MRSRGWLLVILGAVIVGVGLLWKFTPLAEMIQPTKLAARLERFGDTPWGPVAMLALYVIGGFVMMPLLALLTATALVFEPVTAITPRDWSALRTRAIGSPNERSAHSRMSFAPAK